MRYVVQIVALLCAHASMHMVSAEVLQGLGCSGLQSLIEQAVHVLLLFWLAELAVFSLLALSCRHFFCRAAYVWHGACTLVTLCTKAVPRVAVGRAWWDACFCVRFCVPCTSLVPSLMYPKDASWPFLAALLYQTLSS
jgi:hypothetical protein